MNTTSEPRFSRTTNDKSRVTFHARHGVDEGRAACNKRLKLREAFVPAERLAGPYVCHNPACLRRWADELAKFPRRETLMSEDKPKAPDAPDVTAGIAKHSDYFIKMYKDAEADRATIEEHINVLFAEAGAVEVKILDAQILDGGEEGRRYQVQVHYTDKAIHSEVEFTAEIWKMAVVVITLKPEEE